MWGTVTDDEMLREMSRFIGGVMGEKKIETSKGLMLECELEKREGPGWVEYWFQGILVHRSATSAADGVTATGKAADLR